MWIVPPQRALWMPAGVRARHRHARATSPCARSTCATTPPPRMPLSCRVLPVSPLLRELIVRATELPLQLRRGWPGRATSSPCSWPSCTARSRCPAPADAAASQAARRSAGRCSTRRAIRARLGEWARDASMPASAPLARLFQSETGLSFGALAPAGPRARGHGPAGQRRPGDPGGARPRLRQRKRLQRHVPPRCRRLAQRLSAPHVTSHLFQVGDFCVPATVCHTETLTYRLQISPMRDPYAVF